MSLDFYTDGIENEQTVCYDEDDLIRQITSSLVWATLAVGMRTITADNWIEFYGRVSVWERSIAPYRRDDTGQPIYITPEEVHDHIGLRTNAQTETELQWIKRVFQYSLRERRRDAERWQEKSAPGRVTA